MRHCLYMNYNNKGNRVADKSVSHNYSRQPPKYKNKTINTINKKFLSLDKLTSAVLEKYNTDPMMYDEIVGKINMYRINCTIAKECNDAKSQKELTNGIRNYLCELLKKEK